MSMFNSSEVSQTGMHMLHAGSRKLFRYWEGLRAERPCPERSDINLRQIVDIMPNLVILEMNHATREWTYRLAGTEVCALMDSSQTGKSALAGWDSFEKNVVAQSFAIAQERKQPCLVRMRFVFQDAPILPAEMVALPVFDAKAQQIQLIGGIFPLHNGNPFIAAPLMRRELVSARMIWTEHETGDAMLEQVGRRAAPMFRVINGGLA